MSEASPYDSDSDSDRSYQDNDITPTPTPVNLALSKQVDDIIQICKDILQANQAEIKQAKKKANKADEIMVFNGSTPLMRKFKMQLIDKLSAHPTCQPLTDVEKIRYIDDILKDQRIRLGYLNNEAIDGGFDNGVFFDEHSGIFFVFDFESNTGYFGQSDRTILNKMKRYIDDISFHIYESGQQFNIDGITTTIKSCHRRC